MPFEEEIDIDCKYRKKNTHYQINIIKRKFTSSYLVFQKKKKKNVKPFFFSTFFFPFASLVLPEAKLK